MKSTSPLIVRALAVEQAHDREVRDALAGAGLADDAERLAAAEGEADVQTAWTTPSAVGNRTVRPRTSSSVRLRRSIARSCSRVANPWVDERVEDVDDQVRERDGDRGESTTPSTTGRSCWSASLIAR